MGAALIHFAGAADAQPAKYAFGAARAPAGGAAAAFGRYAAGCLSGAVQLPESGPDWQAMRLSRNRNWGHPSVILFIKRLSRAARKAGWAGLYVGDISQPRGGPMTSGHSSHQIGLDVDIWLRAPDRLTLSRSERERISSTSVVARNRLRVNGRWTESHSRVLEAAALDDSVARIFVNAAIKRRLCKTRTKDDAVWLRKVRPWWGHTSHFHVPAALPGEPGLRRAGSVAAGRWLRPDPRLVVHQGSALPAPAGPPQTEAGAHPCGPAVGLPQGAPGAVNKNIYNL